LKMQFITAFVLVQYLCVLFQYINRVSAASIKLKG
jgi:hypothetical protein